jgi:hypothetical protein
MIGAAAIPFGAPPPAALLHDHAPSEAERRQALLRRVLAQLLPDARLFVADGDDEPAAGALLPWGAFSAFSSRTSPSRTIVALRHFEWAPVGEEGDGERGGGALAHRSGERLPDDMGAYARACAHMAAGAGAAAAAAAAGADAGPAPAAAAARTGSAALARLRLGRLAPRLAPLLPPRRRPWRSSRSPR